MKVIITGGGTGGHIYPAIAIADELMRRDSDTEILFVGSEIGMEKDLVPECGYEIELISADGFGRNLRNNVRAARRVIRGRRQAKDIVAEFHPDAVIGTGGYASAPVVSCAERMGVPTYIHEQNAIPGKTNKFLGRNARKIFLGFSRAGKYFRNPEKHVVVGNPVRREFALKERKEARKALGIKDDCFMILAFGGSQGAGRLNREMIHLIESNRDDKNLCVYMGTGSYYYDAVLSELEDKGIKPGENLHIVEYIHDMGEVLNAADLMIGRSGALTVAEVTACGIPAIFVPFPDATENHQYYNALSVQSAGGAVIIEEKDLDRETINRKVQELRSDKSLLDDMRKKCASCGTVDAAEQICNEIEEDTRAFEENGKRRKFRKSEGAGKLGRDAGTEGDAEG